jgi:hypothetical protein
VDKMSRMVFSKERIEELKKERIRKLKMGMDIRTIGALFMFDNGYKFVKYGFGYNLLNVLNESMMSDELKSISE